MKVDCSMSPGDSGQNESPPALRKRRNPLLALLAVNALWGGALGIGFVAGAIALDLGHLRQLLTFTPDGALALALLTIGSIATFASVVMGSAVMMISSDDDRSTRGRPQPTRLVPVPATARAKHRGSKTLPHIDA